MENRLARSFDGVGGLICTLQLPSISTASIVCFENIEINSEVRFDGFQLSITELQPFSINPDAIIRDQQR